MYRELIDSENTWGGDEDAQKVGEAERAVTVNSVSEFRDCTSSTTLNVANAPSISSNTVSGVIKKSGMSSVMLLDTCIRA